MVNLALLSAGFYFFVSGQLDLGGALLSGGTGDRIRALSEVVAAEIRDAEREEWDEILMSYSSDHAVELTLAGERGEPIAGKANAVFPADISTRLRERGAPDLRRPPPERRPPRPGGQREGRGERPPPPRESGRRGDGDRVDPSGIRPAELLFLTSKKVDDRHWFAVRITNRKTRDRGPTTGILVGSTPSLSESGLLPDFKPWLIFGVAAIVVSLLVWIPLVHRITRYLRQMARATEAIASGNFDVKVSEDRSDELGRLGMGINRMSRRLKGYVTGQKRFMSDIAHELCSPIARMQMSVGVLEQRLPEEQRESLDDIREEADHMSAMVNELLSFSRQSLRDSAMELRPVDAATIIAQALHRETGATEEIRVDQVEPTFVLADANLLQRAVANVVRNALLYAGEAGPIRVVVESSDESNVTIRIADSGEGVPEDAVDRLFDPFFRPETARTRETGGNGLGLAIVKMCVESCSGTVSAQNLEPRGFEVALVLRRASTPC